MGVSKVDGGVTKVTNVDENKLMGFGEHIKPVNYSTYKNAKIISEIAIALLLGGVVVGALIASGAIVIPVGLSISGLAVASATSSGFLVGGAISSVVYCKYCKNAVFGILNEITSKIDMPIKLGKSGACDTLVCEDTMASFAWKKKLIESAEHNIVLSGNYCGGQSFDEILDLILNRMDANPNLEVVIISSDKFISASNKERLNNLKEKYPNRFQIVESPDIYHINPGLKKTTNHSKLLAIDYGKYFMLGGSGIEDKYAYAKGLGDRGSQPENNEGGLLNWFLPRGFRDMDFVFHSGDEQGIGKRVYIEAVKLALRWEGMENLKAFNTDVDLAHDFAQTQSVAKKLLLDQVKGKEHPKANTVIPDFDTNPAVNKECRTKIYCIGPEQQNNPFEKELIHRFNKAKKRIVIDHMYFHPTDKVMDALVEAANRGVEIKIITNGQDKESPVSHGAFSSRNRYNYIRLRNKVKPEARKNLEVFEYKVGKTTLHKKVIVCDDYVIAGSSNLGYKSLVTMSDHEINFVTKSKDFADQTAKVALEIDAKVDSIVDGKKVIGHARKIKDFKLRFITIFRAARHRVLAPLIG